MKITSIEYEDVDGDYGTNPCSEIILRPNCFCNLSEVIVRAEDTLDDLRRKVKLAAILGTLQSTLTDFRYLRAIWRRNTEEECLLGVSLTGIMDHAILSGTGSPTKEFLGSWALNGKAVEDWDRKVFLETTLTILSQEAIETNKEWSAKLSVNQSTAITCIKPSGTVSQLVDSSSGIHSRFSPYYIRRVKSDIKDPLTQFMIDKGFPHEQDVSNPTSMVFSFPTKAPEGSKVVSDDTAMQQLEVWQVYQEHWCEHKISMTVYYSDSEFLGIGGWIYDNFDIMSGLSFFPRTDHIYQQAPYEEMSKEEYEDMLKVMPTVDWSDLSSYECDDNTTSAQTLACVSGSCDI